MMVRLPGTSKVIFMSRGNNEAVFDYTNYSEIDNSIAQEDTKVVGNWEDFSGSGTRGPTEVQTAGIVDINQMDLNAKLAGARIGQFTDRGAKAQSVRQRPRLVTIDIGKK